MPRRNRPPRLQARHTPQPPDDRPARPNRALIRDLVAMRREQPNHPRYADDVDVAAAAAAERTNP